VLAACGEPPGGEKEGDEPPPLVQDTPTPSPKPPPPPPIPYVVDFADGKTGFLSLNTGTPGTDNASEFEVTSINGASALRLTAPNGRALRLGIGVDGLLGNRVSDVHIVVFDIYADYPDGNFSAVSGKIAAMSGENLAFSETNWQIYLASRNPVQVAFEIGEDGFAAGPNIIEFSCTTNGPAERGETPADIYITGITFFDASNTAIEINTGGGWDAPDGYGELVILGGWVLPNPPDMGNPGGWQTWHTPGVDNIDDDHMPWQVLAASYGIVFEMDQPDSFEFVYFGSFNGWGWTQVNVVDFWADGKITVMWSDIGFDAFLITEDDNGAKLAMGNWNEAPIDAIYLLYDEDSVDLG